MNNKEFANFKKQILHCPDQSKKGDIDEPIRNVIECINSSDFYVTLSSCSGRSVIVQHFNDVIQKVGCQWHFCCHDIIEPNEFIKCVHSVYRGNATFKFEPFILHVACKTIEDAKCMLSCALISGCKNSGIVIGKHNRYTVAVRNTLQMEVPLTFNGKTLVTEEYIQFLIREANIKMKRNMGQLTKFETNVQKLLQK